MKKIIILVAATVLAILSGCSENKESLVGSHSPELLSIIPKAGNAGTEAVISGYWFGKDASGVSVQINGKSASVVSVSNDRINVVMPENELGTYPITVNVNGKEVEGLKFRYAEPVEKETLAVYAYNPSSGIEGDEIVVTGRCFSHKVAENTVTVNGKNAVIKEAKPTRMVIVLPDNPQGKYSMVVTVNGVEAEGPQFTYLRKPELEITEISPSSASAGSKVTLKGDLFSENPAENIVKFNGIQAEVVSASVKELVVIVPENPLGPCPVTITVGDKTVSGPDFTYLEKVYTYEVNTISGTAGRSDANVFVDGGPAVTKYRAPHALAFMPDGRMIIGDRGNNALKIMDMSTYTTSTIYPEVGSTNLLNAPWRLTVGNDGLVYVVSKANKRLVRYDLSKKSAETVISSGLSDPLDVKLDADGNVYVLDRGAKAVLKYAKGDFTTSEKFAEFTDGPLCMEFDNGGNLIVASNGRKFYCITKDGTKTTIAGDGTKGSSDGNAGEPLTAQFGDIWGFTTTKSGEIYLVDGTYHVVKLIKKGSEGYANATVRTVVGKVGAAGKADGVGQEARLNTPYDISISPSGDKLYVTDLMNFLIREITIKE